MSTASGPCDNAPRAALQLIRRLRPNTLVWLAPVCSSWVWVNRHTSGRSKAIPTGNPAVPSVQQGNQMTSRNHPLDQQVVRWQFEKVPLVAHPRFMDRGGASQCSKGF